MRTASLSHRMTVSESTGKTRLKIWVSEYENTSPKLFVWRRNPGVPECDLDDEFTHVASPADLEELAPDAPDDDSLMYRRHYLTFQTPRPAEARRYLYQIESEVDSLMDELNAMDDPDMVETFEETY